MNISFEDFLKIDIRSGTITNVEEFSRAIKPAYKVWVDFGPEIGTLQTSAQITHHYSIDDLVGKQVMGCVNLGTKNIAGFQSQFLLLGFADKQKHIVLTSPTISVPNGAKLI